MPTPLTCRTIEPGFKFWNGKRIEQVRKTHIGLNCESCEFCPQFPIRIGRDRIEEIRKRHIEMVHWPELVSGRMQISEQEIVWTLSGLSLSS